jgi:hypothetical protein
MWATSPGRCPRSSKHFSAVLATNPALSNAFQKRGISAVLRMRSRLRVAFISTSLHEDVLADCPCEDRRCGGQGLVGDDGRCDCREHGLGVGAPYVGGR